MSETVRQPLWQASCVEQIEPVPLQGEHTADLCIVGGGFTGTSAALAAAARGASVCLLEAGEIGHGGSGRSVGLVNAGLWLPPEEVVATLGKDDGDRLNAALGGAPGMVFELIERHAIDCEAVRNGTLHCAHSPAGVKDLENRFAQGVSIGAPYVLINRDETRARTGSEVFHGALFDPRAGTIQPLSYCRGLARAAAGLGAQIFQNSPVHSIAASPGGWTVTANGHAVTATSVIVATNAYHRMINAPFRPEFVRVHYSQFATAPLSAPELEEVIPRREGCWDTARVMSSFRLDAAGRLIIGGMGNLDGPAGKVHDDWARRKLRSLYPRVNADSFDYCWQGDIAITSDRIPKIVEFAPNALACFGYSGRGIGPGTVFGACAAEALLDNDYERLPLPPLVHYSESFHRSREAYFEFGAALVHATDLPL